MTQPQTVEIQTDEQAEARDMTATLTHRLAEIKPRGVDVDARRIEMSISSEQPVARSYGNEILEHSEGAIDLEFISSGRAPLLLDHDPSQQIGIIESVKLDGEARRLRATARLGRGELATSILRDVEDGIRTNISVGYSIDKLERKGTGDDFVATRWRPLEASLVSIPADTSDIVGVGRSNQTEITTPETTHTEAIVAEDNNAIDMDAVRAEALADAQKAAQKQVAQILELGARHNQVDMAREAIQAGQQVDAFRDALLTKIETQALVAANDADIDLSAKDKKRFNLARAISAMVNPSDRRAQEAAAYEFEVSEAVAQRSGRAAQGVLMPHSVLVRDMTTTHDAAIVTDDYRGDQFIDALRNASSVMAAGATTLTGLSGDVKIPRKSAGASAGWVSSEGGATSDSEMTLATVSLAPKTLGAFTDVTRQLLIQSSEDIDRLIRDDLTTAIAIAIDKAALEGSGSSGQPTGILNTSSVNTVTFAAANPTFAEAVSLQTAVSEDNALFGNLSYIVPPAMYGALKTTEKATNTAQFVVENDGSIAGYNAIVSAQATAGNLYFGNFSDCLVGFFGSGVDIIVDTSTGATAGTQRIVALQSVDVAVRHAVSFAFGNDG